MAVREQLVNDVGKIEELLDLVCHFFHIPELLEDQKEALKQFFSSKELYFSALTGFGNSLIFQCIPLIIATRAIDVTKIRPPTRLRQTNTSRPAHLTDLE